MLYLLHEDIPTTHQDQSDDGERDTLVLTWVLRHGDIKVIVKVIAETHCRFKKQVILTTFLVQFEEGNPHVTPVLRYFSPSVFLT